MIGIALFIWNHIGPGTSLVAYAVGVGCAYEIGYRRGRRNLIEAARRAERKGHKTRSL